MTSWEPTTIEEFKWFADTKNIPLDKLRIRLGEDAKEPSTYGIYKEGSEVILYKNKADGSRSIRYQGPDETFAVKELWSKMFELRQTDSSAETTGKKRKGSCLVSFLVCVGIPVLCIVVSIYVLFGSTIYAAIRAALHMPMYPEGYICQDGSYYHSSGYQWWVYDEYEEWTPVIDKEEANRLSENFEENQVSVDEIKKSGMEQILEKWEE